ncbi:MAG TPA: protein-disulfide reductase DsbD domain-containing protein [Bryobacteraceae bacterium]|nr:protein-disulfide reductase DsbD domain-containing protein [Bryobacteraceae bacterium]
MKKILATFSSVAIFMGLAPCAAAQGQYLSVAPPQKVIVKRGAVAEAKLTVELQPGFHVNSDKPADEYLIPLRLRWEPGGLAATETVFPKAEARSYSFSQKPVSVFTEKFPIVTRFKAADGATVGPGFLTGKLRYQACTEDRCFPPKTIEVKLPYSIQ